MLNLDTIASCLSPWIWYETFLSKFLHPKTYSTFTSYWNKNVKIDLFKCQSMPIIPENVSDERRYLTILNEGHWAFFNVFLCEKNNIRNCLISFIHTKCLTKISFEILEIPFKLFLCTKMTVYQLKFAYSFSWIWRLVTQQNPLYIASHTETFLVHPVAQPEIKSW